MSTAPSSRPARTSWSSVRAALRSLCRQCSASKALRWRLGKPRACSCSRASRRRTWCSRSTATAGGSSGGRSAPGAPESLTFRSRTSDRGGFGVTLTLVRDHQLIRRTAQVFVPWDDRRLDLAFTSFRDNDATRHQRDLLGHGSQPRRRSRRQRRRRAAGLYVRPQPRHLWPPQPAEPTLALPEPHRHRPAVGQPRHRPAGVGSLEPARSAQLSPSPR